MNFKADQINEETYSKLLAAANDITGCVVTQVLTKGDVLWVNVNGVCVSPHLPHSTPSHRE